MPDPNDQAYYDNLLKESQGLLDNAAQIQAPEPSTVSAPPVNQELVGVLGAIPKGLWSGVSRVLPEQAQKASRFLGMSETPQREDLINEREVAAQAQPKFTGKVAETLYRGSEMLPVSLGPQVVGGVIGGVTGAPAGPLGVVGGVVTGATAAGMATAPLMGAAQGQETRETALINKPEEAPGAAPWITAGLETGFEVASNAFLGGIIGKAFKTPIKAAAAGLKNTLLNYAKKTGIYGAEVAGAEVIPEWLTAYSQAQVEKAYGIRPDADPIGEANAVIGPTAVMSIMGGGGVAAAQHFLTPRNPNLQTPGAPLTDVFQNFGEIPGPTPPAGPLVSVEPDLRFLGTVEHGVEPNPNQLPGPANMLPKEVLTSQGLPWNADVAGWTGPEGNAQSWFPEDNAQPVDETQQGVWKPPVQAAQTVQNPQSDYPTSSSAPQIDMTKLEPSSWPMNQPPAPPKVWPGYRAPQQPPQAATPNEVSAPVDMTAGPGRKVQTASIAERINESSKVADILENTTNLFTQVHPTTGDLIFRDPERSMTDLMQSSGILYNESYQGWVASPAQATELTPSLQTFFPAPTPHPSAEGFSRAASTALSKTEDIAPVTSAEQVPGLPPQTGDQALSGGGQVLPPSTVPGFGTSVPPAGRRAPMAKTPPAAVTPLEQAIETARTQMGPGVTSLEPSMGTSKKTTQKARQAASKTTGTQGRLWDLPGGLAVKKQGPAEGLVKPGVTPPTAIHRSFYDKLKTLMAPGQKGVGGKMIMPNPESKSDVGARMNSGFGMPTAVKGFSESAVEKLSKYTPELRGVAEPEKIIMSNGEAFWHSDRTAYRYDISNHYDADIDTLGIWKQAALIHNANPHAHPGVVFSNLIKKQGYSGYVFNFDEAGKERWAATFTPVKVKENLGKMSVQEQPLQSTQTGQPFEPAPEGIKFDGEMMGYRQFTDTQSGRTLLKDPNETMDTFIKRLRPEGKLMTESGQPETVEEWAGEQQTIKHSAVEKFITKLNLSLPSGLQVQAIRTVQDLPSVAKTLIGNIGPDSVVYGYMDPDGTCYLVTSAFQEINHMYETLAHELIGHYGIEHMVGPKAFEKMMLEAYDSMMSHADTKAEMTAIWKRYNRIGETPNFDLNKPSGRIKLMSEMVAHISETMENPSWFQDIVSSIRAMLRKMGFTIEWTNQDIRSMLQRSSDYIFNGTPVKSTGTENQFMVRSDDPFRSGSLMADLDTSQLTAAVPPADINYLANGKLMPQLKDLPDDPAVHRLWTAVSATMKSIMNPAHPYLSLNRSMVEDMLGRQPKLSGPARAAWTDLQNFYVSALGTTAEPKRVKITTEPTDIPERMGRFAIKKGGPLKDDEFYKTYLKPYMDQAKRDIDLAGPTGIQAWIRNNRPTVKADSDRAVQAIAKLLDEYKKSLPETKPDADTIIAPEKMANWQEEVAKTREFVKRFKLTVDAYRDIWISALAEQGGKTETRPAGRQDYTINGKPLPDFTRSDSQAVKVTMEKINQLLKILSGDSPGKRMYAQLGVQKVLKNVGKGELGSWRPGLSSSTFQELVDLRKWYYDTFGRIDWRNPPEKFQKVDVKKIAPEGKLSVQSSTGEVIQPENVTRKGDWKDSKGNTLFANYKDNVSGSNFTVAPGENLREKLLSTRKKFVDAGNIPASALEIRDNGGKFLVRQGKPPSGPTMKAYKLFRTLKTRPGEIFPLFIGNKDSIPMNEWLTAEPLKTAGYADRPGWHSGAKPSAPHLTETNRVWAEVEVPATAEARVTGQPPSQNGQYRYAVNKAQGGEWIISGSIKVNKLLTPEEVTQEREGGKLAVRNDVGGQFTQPNDRWYAQPMTLQDRFHEIMNSVKSWWKEHITPQLQHFKDIDYSDKSQLPIVEYLRQAEEIPRYARELTGRLNQRLLNTLKKPQDRDTFEHIIILRDLLREVTAGKVASLGPQNVSDTLSAQGYANLDQLRAHITHFESLATPAVNTALNLRKEFWDRWRNKAVTADILPASVLDNESYFHHQVKEWQELNDRFSGTAPGMHKTKKSFQKGRTGYSGEYNLNYFEAETGVLVDLITQVQSAKSLEAIRSDDKLNVLPRLVAEADRLNALNPPTKETWRTVLKRGNIIDSFGNAITEQTHDFYKPVRGNFFHRVLTLTERSIRKVAEELNTVVGGVPTIDELMDIARMNAGTALASGLRQPLTSNYMVLNRQVITAMEHFQEQSEPSFLGRFSGYLQTQWKRWVLFNPFRVTRYLLNNTTGDADIAFAFRPAIFKQIPTAYRELFAWAYKNSAGLSNPVKNTLETLNRKGLLGSGITVHEIPELSDDTLVKLINDPRPQLIKRWFKGVHKFNNFRENIMRYAAWKYMKSESDAGRFDDLHYAASKKAEVDSITSADDKIIKMSRELIGDYGNISYVGGKLRKYVIPFWSWAEINAPRYFHMMRNELQAGNRAGGLKVAGVLGAKAAVRAGAFAALVMAWNFAFFRDEEEEMRRLGRDQLHLILGRHSDGSVISLRVQGSFSDTLGWVGAENLLEELRSLKKGRVTLGEEAKSIVMSPVKRIIGGAIPLYKTAGEAAVGRTKFPEPFAARPIRDKFQHIMKGIGADWITDRWVQHKPAPPLFSLKAIAKPFLYVTDTHEAAYFHAIKLANDWLEDEGMPRTTSEPTPRSNALYYWRQAAKLKDKEGTEYYKALYFKLGGKPSGMEQSIKHTNPLVIIPLKYRAKFLASMGEDNKKTWLMGVKWWGDTFKGSKTGEPNQQPSSVDSEE